MSCLISDLRSNVINPCVCILLCDEDNLIEIGKNLNIVCGCESNCFEDRNIYLVGELCVVKDLPFATYQRAAFTTLKAYTRRQHENVLHRAERHPERIVSF